MQIKDKVLDVPVIQGGMGVGVSLSSLAGAVAANGACGVISSVNAGYDEQDFKSSPLKANLRALDYHIKRAKQIAAESTKKGLVAVNIMTAVSHYEESCKTAVSAGADIISQVQDFLLICHSLLREQIHWQHLLFQVAGLPG